MEKQNSKPIKLFAMKNKFHFLIAVFSFCLSLSSFSQQVVLKNGDLPTPQHLGPSCQFSVLNYCYGDTTYFMNQTIRMMNPSWEIADTSGIIFSSVDTNIKFFFPAMGTYSVTLRADNGHPDSIIKAIVIDTATNADFTFQQCSQRFINMSSCATSFYWNFGDSSSSTDSLPVHLYADTGSYTVTLIVFNGTVSDTLTQNIYVYSEGFPTANFTYFQSNDTVYFFGDTVANNFNWDFGDQATSTLQNPAHVYTDTGDFNVSLFVNNYCDIKFQSQLVHVFSTSGVFSHDEENIPITIFPNPFRDAATLKISDSRFKNLQVKITDVFGREVTQSVIPSGTGYLTINRGNLNSGIYFVSVLSEGKNIGRSKLIIE